MTPADKLAALEPILRRMIEARDKTVGDRWEAHKRIVYSEDREIADCSFSDCHISHEDNANFIATAANAIDEIKQILGE